MYKLVILFFFIGCQTSTGEIKSVQLNNYDEISINVVEKKLINKTNLPNEMTLLINEWFNEIKVNGFQGNVIFEITQYNEITSEISNGKKIELILKMNVNIDTSNNLSKKKNLKIDLNEYGTITGNFSLNEFDNLIFNTQKNLIKSLVKTLSSQI